MTHPNIAYAHENVKLPADLAAAAGLYDECTVDIRGLSVITTFWPASGSDTCWIGIADEPGDPELAMAAVDAANNDPAAYALALLDLAVVKLQRGEIECN